MLRFLAYFLIGLFASVSLFFVTAQIAIAETPAEAVEAVRQAIYLDLLSTPDIAARPELAAVNAQVAFSPDGNYAMGAWVYGETGGVTIVQRNGNTWTYFCSTGGAYTDGNEIAQFCPGISLETAQQLHQQWRAISY